MSDTPTSSTPPSTRRLLWGLVLVLAAWGVYLAIGATGVFTDVGLLDARRSAIVLACSASFLGFWLWILSRRRSTEATTGSPQNRTSRRSLVAATLAYGLWGAAWWAWLAGNPAQLTFFLGWGALGLFAIAAILALIGLSDPLRPAGKLWGLVTLLLLLIAVVALIAQVRSFARSQRGPTAAVITAAEAAAVPEAD